jgi:hypothetical protein
MSLILTDAGIPEKLTGKKTMARREYETVHGKDEHTNRHDGHYGSRESFSKGKSY